MFPRRRNSTGDELEYILNQDLDDEFMNDIIWDDTSDDDGSDSASGDDSQLDSVHCTGTRW